MPTILLNHQYFLCTFDCLPVVSVCCLSITPGNNDDWWRVVIGFAGPGRYLQLATVNKSLRDHHAAVKFESKTFLRAMCESTSLCQWAREQGCPWDETLCAAAAAGGNLATLKWARGDVAAGAAAASVAQGLNQDPSIHLGGGEDSTGGASADISTPLTVRVCAWDARTAAAAAGGGHLEVLQWACNSGCPVDNTACWAAALGGHLPVMRWLHQQTPRCEWQGWDDEDVAAAVTRGDSDPDEDPQHHQQQCALAVMGYGVDEAPGEGGKCAAIVAVMRADIANAEAQTWGMYVMHHLAVNFPQTVAELRAAGACEALVAGMKAHPSHVIVQHNSMAVIALHPHTHGDHH
jgi:hypothetical protein